MAESADSTLSDEELERQLENWARWCSDVPVQGGCMSIESRYRSPQSWDAPPPVSPRPAVDRDAALAVNRAWGAMPQPWKTVLRNWYVYHANPKMTCRRIRIPFRAHEDYLRDARHMIRNLLTRHGWASIVRPD